MVLKSLNAPLKKTGTLVIRLDKRETVIIVKWMGYIPFKNVYMLYKIMEKRTECVFKWSILFIPFKEALHDLSIIFLWHQ